MPLKILIFFTMIFITAAYLSREYSYAWEKTIQIDDKGRHEASIELDPYYSNIGYVYSLTDAPIPKEPYTREIYVYLYLLKNIYLPRYILLEASLYPLPIAGVYIKKNRTNFYEDSQLTRNFNAVKAITAGFPEPWAFSFFLGNVVDFVIEDEEKREIVGKGYSGLLMSYGNRHIVDNIMVDDKWFETEIKLKGQDIREKRDLSWSYAVGYKGHDNREIKDALYLSIKRNRIDYMDYDVNPVIKFLAYNSEVEVRFDFDLKEVAQGKIVRYFFLFGKKFVLGEGGVTLAFGIGMLKTVASGYTGKLEQQIDEHWQLILRPNVHIKF